MGDYKNLVGTLEREPEAGPWTGGVEAGTFRHDDSFASRFESADGTNPEELVAAAHVTIGEVDGVPTTTTSALVARALAGVDVTLDVTLVE